MKADELEDDVADASKKNSDRVDPDWPQTPESGAPVSELATECQGSMSPFGELSFPLPEGSVPYHHPETKINK